MASLPPPSPISLPRRHLVLALLLILALASAVLYFWYEPNFGAGADEASYLLAAKSLALHGTPAYHNPDPLLFVPKNMVEPRPGVYYPIYPIGYPLLAAAGYLLGGPQAAFLVNPVITLLALLGAFFFLRLFVSDLFAAAGTLLLALHSAILRFGVAAMSHIPDLACATWGLYFSVLWYRKPALWKIFLAGTLFGYALSIRYTEALLLLPLLWLMAWWVWELPTGAPRLRRILPHAAAAALGYLLGVAPTLWYHTIAFGSPFRTGYGLRNESSSFSLHFFLDHIGFTLKMLCTLPNGLLLLPVAVIALFLRKWVTWRDAGFLALAFIPTILLYSAYYWMNSTEPLLYARFFLPTFPAILVAALIPLDHATRRWRPLHFGLLFLLVLYASINLGHAPAQTRFNGVLLFHEAATDMVRAQLPPHAVIVAADDTAYSLTYYTDMSVIYPRYFMEPWINSQIEPPPPGSALPTNFNALRESEFRAAVGNRSQSELYNLLADKLLTSARDGRTVGLLGADMDNKWYSYLAEKFRFTMLARNDDAGLTLWRLEPK
jgi:hypothetical protein